MWSGTITHQPSEETMCSTPKSTSTYITCAKLATQKGLQTTSVIIQAKQSGENAETWPGPLNKKKKSTLTASARIMTTGFSVVTFLSPIASSTSIQCSLSKDVMRGGRTAVQSHVA